MNISTLYCKFQECGSVTTDSRNCPCNSIFFALKGGNFNGNAYAANALEAGCAYAVIDEEEYAVQGDARYIIVDNCLRALQQLANYHRQQLSTPLIGITGTNGKTTTKELMAAVLSQSYCILYTEGNLNNHIGVPLTLLRLKPQHQIGIIEMGASHPGDIKELVDIAQPDYGIITNVGKAHLEGFGSFQGVISTKGELYDFIRRNETPKIFIHHNNQILMDMAKGIDKIEYGSEEDLYVSGRITGNSPYLNFEWKAGKENKAHDVHTQLIGEYNLPNALAAVAVGVYFDVESAKINQALADYTPQNNRSQLKHTQRNTLIIDAYNANPTSMQASLSNFHNMRVDGKMLILGDMRELGKDGAEEHQKIVDLLTEWKFKDVMLVGELFAATKGHCFATYKDAAEVIEALKSNSPQGKTILIKGSNGIKLSSVVDYL